jgi:hypothetical protein
MPLKKHFSILTLLVACFLVLAAFFGDILFHPNSYSFPQRGDVLKNYYTPAYYLKYNQILRI